MNKILLGVGMAASMSCVCHAEDIDANYDVTNFESQQSDINQNVDEVKEDIMPTDNNAIDTLDNNSKDIVPEKIEATKTEENAEPLVFDKIKSLPEYETHDRLDMKYVKQASLGKLKNTSYLNLRVGPSITSKRKGVIYNSDTLTILNRYPNGWLKVKLIDGTIGYCSGKYVKNYNGKVVTAPKLTVAKNKVPTNAIKKSQAVIPKSRQVLSQAEKSQKVTSYAKNFLGTKYVWGGTSPNGFDCSGFTQYVYKNALGVDIPRVSYMQATAGYETSYSNKKVGDLLCFDTIGKGKVSHVGIYLGNNKFIHASGSMTNPDKVKISSLSEKWLNLMNIRRLF